MSSVGIHETDYGKQASEEAVALSPAARAEIDKWLAKFPADKKQSAVIPALTFVQKEQGGWLSKPVMDAVAAYLDIPKIAVYEVATFYSMFDTEPVGKHKINVCVNISCLLCGAEKITAHLERKLGIQCGQTTRDGKFTLRGVECLAACTKAPMMTIDDQYYENLTLEKVDAIVDEYSQK